MGVVVSSGGQAADADLVYRIVEDNCGTMPWLGVNSQPAPILFSGPYGVDRLGADPVLLGAGSGGAQQFGQRITQMTSGAGRTFRRGSSCSVPLSRKYQTADALPLTLNNNRPRSYLYQVPCRLTVLNAGHRGEISLCDADNSVNSDVLAVCRAGPAWVWDQTLNAGALIPFWRQTNGVAGIFGANTTVSMLNVWRLLGIKYYELATGGRVDWILDNRVLFSVAGDVNMPLFAGGGTIEPGWTPMVAQFAGAGSNLQMGDAMYEVRYIG